MPGHDVARHVASVGRGLPSVAGDRRRDGLAVMSLDWLRAGGKWEASERKEGRRWEEKCSRWWRLVAMDVGRCQARVIGLGDAVQADADASATR